MAATTSGHSYGAVDQINKLQIVTLNGVFTDFEHFEHYYCGFTVNLLSDPGVQYPVNVITGYTGFYSFPYAPGALSLTLDGVTYGQMYTGPKMQCDRSYSYRAYEYYGSFIDERLGPKIGSALTLKAYAIDATFGTPSATNPQSNSIDFSCNWYPNTYESTATATLQYKRTVDPMWSDYSSSSPMSGYGVQAYVATVGGLVGSTSYQFRIKVTRTTTNTTEYYSSTASATTLADAPTATTDPATSIGSTSAYLNATVDPNNISSTVTFEWDDNSGVPYANETGSSVETGDGNRSVSKQISGLTALHTYYFRVKVVYSGGTVYGSERSFVTTENPDETARAQEMLPIQNFDRKYNVPTTIFFVVPQAALDSSNLFYSAGVVWSAGEVKITKATYNDTKTPTVAGPTDSTNLPVQVSGSIYRLDLEAAEMAADELFITLTNAGTSVRDVLLRVRTNFQLGTIDVDALTGPRTNADAVKLRGHGSGFALNQIGGTTAGGDVAGRLKSMVLRAGTAQAGGNSTIQLDLGALTTLNYYVGSIVMIVGGPGAGQSRVIIGYATDRQATVNRPWASNPTSASEYILVAGADVWEIASTGELQALPTSTAKFGQFLQFLFQRFAYCRTQTASTFTMYRLNQVPPSGTTLGGGTVSDDGSIQIAGQLS